MKTIILIKKEDISTHIYGNTIGLTLGPDTLASITVEAMDELVADYKTLRGMLVDEKPGDVQQLEDSQ